MHVDLKQVASDLRQLHRSKLAEYSEQLATAKEIDGLAKDLKASAQTTKKFTKNIEGALKQLGEELPASKPGTGPSKEQVKDQVLAAARAYLEKHGDLSDAKLRESIKQSLPEIDLTGRLRRFSDWLRADERVREVSSGVWALRTVTAQAASNTQLAETPAKRQLPPR